MPEKSEANRADATCINDNAAAVAKTVEIQLHRSFASTDQPRLLGAARRVSSLTPHTPITASLIPQHAALTVAHEPFSVQINETGLHEPPPLHQPNTTTPPSPPPAPLPSLSASHTCTAKSLVRQGTFSNQLYRFLRLCFLRRWTWQMFGVCWRVYGRRRPMHRGDDSGDGRSGEAGEWVEAEENDDEYAEDYLDTHSLPSNDNRSDLPSRITYDDTEQDDWSSNRNNNNNGNSGIRSGGLLVRGTRRRGRGPAVSPTSGPARRDLRRSRGEAVQTHRDANHNSATSANNCTLAQGCRLFCVFLFCCCCCRLDGPLQCKNSWLARLLYQLRVLWTRHRAVAWCLLALLVLLHWLVVWPLISAGVSALLESEDVFVQRLMLLGLPGEVDPPPGPKAVLVQLSEPLQLSELVKAAEGRLEAFQVSVDTVRARAVDIAQRPMRLTFAQQYLPFHLPFLSRYSTLQLSQLPSWTLYPFTEDCEECIEGAVYAAAVAGAFRRTSNPAFVSSVLKTEKWVEAGKSRQNSPGRFASLSSSAALSPAVRHGVFATANALLGRIGPMLLAMASVTDDVSLVNEIGRWSWLPRVSRHDNLMKALRRGAAPAYLGVLGIPSSDYSARAALRYAQRQSWLTYTDVARTENNFRGKLLTLYVLAAAERRRVRAAPRLRTSAETATAAGASPDPQAGYISLDAQRLCHDVRAMLPTAAEFMAAAEVHAIALRPSQNVTTTTTVEEQQSVKLTELAAAQGAAMTRSYTERRMTLHRGWQHGDSIDSPCDRLVEKKVTSAFSDTDRNYSGVSASATAAFLAAYLELPAAPLFTVPAHLVCHASTALWQEALAHRNMLWVDMVTDRRPTTKKKLGEGGNWGLPVEVGMSQKLILWLEYAYHAFPDVPYIMKGDDDTYLKVPQFLNDVRYIQRGRSGRALSELTRSDGGSAALGRRELKSGRRIFNSATAAENYLTVRATEECVYWGSMRRWNGEVYFGAGMLFLLHRRLVQTVLEERPEYNNDVVRLASQDYAPRHAHSYFAAMMDHEDVMLGKLLAERRMRSNQLCPFGRAWHVWERWDRFHDVRRGRAQNVTWATVAAHRCTPADFPYLHFFFQQEYRFGREGAAVERDVAVARQQARAWLEAAQLENNGTADGQPGTPEYTGIRLQATPVPAVGNGELLEVVWAESPARNHTPLPFVRSSLDGVAVYEVEYSPFADGFLVPDGWVSNTRRRSERQ